MFSLDGEEWAVGTRKLFRDLQTYYEQMDPKELALLDYRIDRGFWLSPEGQQAEQLASVEHCYTLEQAAPILGKSHAVLLKMARSRRLGAFRAKGRGNTWYIWRGTMEAYLASRRL